MVDVHFEAFRGLRPTLKRVLGLATIGVICFGLGAFAPPSPVMTLIVVGAAFCLVLYLARPEWTPFIALFSAFAALPTFIPTIVTITEITVYAYEILLAVAVISLTSQRIYRLGAFSVPAIFGIFVAIGVAMGISSGNEFRWVIWEAKPLLMMGVGFSIAVLIIECGLLHQIIRFAEVVMWVSAILVVTGSLTGLSIRGRNESLKDVTGQAVGQVERLVTAAQIPALAILAALLAGMIYGIVGRDLLLRLGIPALVITLLGFSRSSLVALAVTGAAAVVIGAKHVSFTRLMRLIATSIAAIFVLTAAVQLMRLLGTGGWIVDQVTGFSQRVLGGVIIGTDRDLSWQYRSDELTHLWPAISREPLLGNGFGFAYQTPQGPTGSWLRVYAPFYSHNFYLWLLAKTGFVGLIAFTWFALTPILHAFRSAAVGAKIAATVAIALLSISFVWPVPETEPDSIVMGIVLGAAFALSHLPAQREAQWRATNSPVAAIVMRGKDLRAARI